MELIVKENGQDVQKESDPVHEAQIVVLHLVHKLLTESTNSSGPSHFDQQELLPSGTL